MAKVKVATPRKRTLTEEAYEVIKRGIQRGEIGEGAFLSEGEVRRKYGIGRTPFREACNRLHHEQLLEVVPRRGYLVSEISFRAVREMFEVRLILEGVIAELAALRRTAEDAEELERLAQRTWSSTASKNSPEEMVKANTRFHLCIARMAQNRELLRLVTGILDRTERLSYLELRSTQVRRADIQCLHRSIVEAIRKKDPVAAREAMVSDIAQGQLDILGTYDWNPDHKWLHVALSKAPPE